MVMFLENKIKFHIDCFWLQAFHCESREKHTEHVSAAVEPNGCLIRFVTIGPSILSATSFTFFFIIVYKLIFASG